MMTGTIANAAAILIGGGLGCLLKDRLKFAQSIIPVLGLCVGIIGISGAIGGDFILLVISLAAGTFLGELLRIDDHLNRLGMFAQEKLSKNDKDNNTFAEGFITSTLLFCVGAMAIVGSIDSGLRGDHSIIFTKSIIDGITAMVLASSLGYGVLFSAIMVFIYQGAIVIFAGNLQDVFTPTLITQISAVGGVMIFGIGLNMSINAGLKVANFLPGFLVAAAYYFFVY